MNTPKGFWNELWRTEKSERPEVVRKYGLDKTPEKLNYVAANMYDIFGVISSVRSDLIDKGSVDQTSEIFKEFVLIMEGKR
jgi:hypothetical protein